MVDYSFKDRFVAPILAGTKRNTIRAVGKKRHVQTGETIGMRCGPRFRPRYFCRAVCDGVFPIVIELDPFQGSRWFRIDVLVPRQYGGTIRLRDPEQCDRFARGDGFADREDMRAFWVETHGGKSEGRIMFEGIIIGWGAVRPIPEPIEGGS